MPVQSEEDLKVRLAGRHARMASVAMQDEASPAFFFRLIVNDNPSTLHVSRQPGLLVW
jgi:hypothetical protein